MNNHFSANFDLPALVEALLFVSSVPVSASHLASVLEVSLAQIEQAIQDLESRLLSKEQPSYLRLQKHQGRYQLITAPEIAPVVERHLGLEATGRLTQAGLETLAVVAYRQPITRPQIEAIRGVNSDSVLKTLLSKGLIQEVGRAEAPGRPILYAVTTEFLQHFGLQSIEELPPWTEEVGNPSGNDAETIVEKNSTEE